MPPPFTCIDILGSPVGIPKDEAAAASAFVTNVAFSRLKEVEDHQIRLVLLRETMSQAINHLARTVPPSCVKTIFKSYDGRLLDVIRSCLEAQPDEISAVTRQEISLPITSGGLGFPRLADTCQYAYFASVTAVIQTWRQFIKADDPLLTSWCTDVVDPSDPSDFVTPLPQQLSKFNLTRELKACLHMSRNIASQAVATKQSSNSSSSKSKKAKKPATVNTTTAASSSSPDFSSTTSYSSSGAPVSSVLKNAFALSILPANLAGFFVTTSRQSFNPCCTSARLPSM